MLNLSQRLFLQGKGRRVIVFLLSFGLGRAETWSKRIYLNPTSAWNYSVVGTETA